MSFQYVEYKLKKKKKLMEKNIYLTCSYQRQGIREGGRNGGRWSKGTIPQSQDKKVVEV